MGVSSSATLMYHILSVLLQVMSYEDSLLSMQRNSLYLPMRSMLRLGESKSICVSRTDYEAAKTIEDYLGLEPYRNLIARQCFGTAKVEEKRENASKPEENFRDAHYFETTNISYCCVIIRASWIAKGFHLALLSWVEITKITDLEPPSQ